MTTRVGEIEYERMYYYDADANRGDLPLDASLGIDTDSGVSRAVRQMAAKMGSLMPYGQSAQLYAELTGVAISAPSIWRVVQEAGDKALQLECANKFNPAIAAKYVANDDDQLGVTLDGFMVNVRAEGWKEVKAGCVFKFEERVEPKLTKHGEEIADVHAKAKTYVSHLGGPEGIGMKLFGEASRRGWQRAGKRVVIGDGASWIWGQASIYFAKAAHIVDWYHAKQHVSAAAAMLYPEAAQAAAKTAWTTTHSDQLYTGQADALAASLKETQAETEAGYFEDNYQRLQYQDFQRDGLPIGSGTIEAGAKRYKQRLCASGMRWSRA
ncbi:MAG: UPF0236 family protein, partial [Thermoflexales bacterium]